MIRLTFYLLFCIAVIGCANLIPLQNAVIVHGRVLDKYSVTKQPRHPISADHTLFMHGAVGVMLAGVMGIQEHTKYTIQNKAGGTFILELKEDFEVGNCLKIEASESSISGGYIELGRANVQAGTECAAFIPKADKPLVKDWVVPQKSGRPN